MNNESSRPSYEGKKATAQKGRAFEAWAEDRAIPIGVKPPALLVALYMVERATGSWKPNDPSAKDRLKLWSLRVIPSGLADYLAQAYGCDTSNLVENEALGNLLANLKARLPLRQTAVVRARPVTKEVHLLLLEFLDRMGERGWAHSLWVLRWKSLITLGHFAGLRISELIRLRLSWLDWAEDTEGTRILVITIPHSKWNQGPRTIMVWGAAEEARCPLRLTRQWMEALATAGYPLTRGARLFPEVRRPVRQRRCSVAGLTVADFPEVAADLVSGDPTTIPAGSTKVLTWRCTHCSHEWSSRVQNRTYGQGCPACAHRRVPGIPEPADTPVVVDTHAELLEDDDWRDDLEDAERSGAGMALLVSREPYTFKQLCRKAGFDPRDAWERISTGGLRRGTAVELHRAGASRDEIAAHLGHSRPDISLPYIEELDLDPPALLRDMIGRA